MNKKMYRTDNFYAAAFLVARGQTLLKCEKLSDKKVEFLFNKSDELDKFVNAYFFDEEGSEDRAVDIYEISSAIKKIKAIMYEVISIKS